MGGESARMTRGAGVVSASECRREIGRPVNMCVHSLGRNEDPGGITMSHVRFLRRRRR